MKKLLSLPPNLVEVFHEVTGLSRDEYFCTCDPIGHRLGSGGGTAWLLQEACRAESATDIGSWLCQEKRILIHAGGQSRRLPSYAVSGKVLMPLPVFRWERGQRLSQNLLSVQLPLYEKMMAMAPDNIHTMVVSGDVLIRATQPLQSIPEADVVCYGLWLDASVARNHGVFVSSRQTPSVLKQMLQKPSVQTLTDLQRDHFYLTDIGIWLLSDKAVRLLMQRSTVANNVQCSMFNVQWKEYDLYSEFGCCLGTDPTILDDELRELKVAILPLAGGEFYHFGTSREMISSTLRLQNLVNDQREIMHIDRKPHPSVFVQNAVMARTFLLSPTFFSKHSSGELTAKLQMFPKASFIMKSCFFIEAFCPHVIRQHIQIDPLQIQFTKCNFQQHFRSGQRYIMPLSFCPQADSIKRMSIYPVDIFQADGPEVVVIIIRDGIMPVSFRK